ncbi:MAG TPA: molybdopterin dinucleotide binding domain-containing protein, partial [Candidatus Dormibacteraeota bacterium]|nr:molybdopterin dinucleotide binding domain-containing protein [Candidatus Dormibacteraeota bacterium]
QEGDEGDGGRHGLAQTSMAAEGTATGVHAHGTVHYDSKNGKWSYGESEPAGEKYRIERDETLEHPRCVFQVLKRHYARYTPEMVERVCGTPRADFEHVARTLAANSGRERTGVICYAVGWTQQSVGPQIIRSAAILQLLLGNIGRPGGGILALRGHASIQGSTDIPTLYDLLPGYLPQPLAGGKHKDLESYCKVGRQPRGTWNSFPAYTVSLLKAWYGDAGTIENDFGYDWLPKRTGDHSEQATFGEMLHDRCKGYLVLGQNPAAGNTNARLVREALKHLDWMVVRDLFETETASFWYRAPGAEPSKIKTEVIFIPAAASAEKDGCFTNTMRLLQYHHKAVDPPGDARSESWFMYHLGLRMKELYGDSTLARDRGIQALTWDYAPSAETNARFRIKDEPAVENVLEEINGWHVPEHGGRGEQLRDFSELKDDGSTACGTWIYCGVMPEKGKNLAASRDNSQPTHQGWGFAWPRNTRILYNRASADPQGKPWSEGKRYVWWNEEQGQWVGADTPDFPRDKDPGYRPQPEDEGLKGIAGDSPFSLKPDGKGWLFAPTGLADGPLPTFYEPTEAPEPNALYEQQDNPLVRRFDDLPMNEKIDLGDPRFPHVLTTFRLTEHHVSGQMSRWNSWLSELQPEMFVEISPELADSLGIVNSGWATLTTPRGQIEAKALVTRRIRPFQVNGRTLHQVAIPFHYGYAGGVRGEIANDLLSLTEEPNVAINETKALMCHVRAGRKNLVSE